MTDQPGATQKELLYLNKTPQQEKVSELRNLEGYNRRNSSGLKEVIPFRATRLKVAHKSLKVKQSFSKFKT